MPRFQQRPTTALSSLKNARYLWAALAFGLPVLLLGTAFALHGVYPFGDRQIMVTDFWQQYYPFFSEYRHRLRGGGSLLWSWSIGGGTNYPALTAYYLASPLNLLTALFPHRSLREVLTAILLVKVGLAGLFTAVFLRTAFPWRERLLPVFAALYALCAFSLGYYWNIMWLDTFALLPLVAAGVTALVRDGRWRLFTVSLGLSVLINYYIGFFSCIFTALLFFALCFVWRLPPRTLLRRLALIAGCSALALGFSAVLTLPAYFALQNSHSAANAFPSTLRLYESFFDILGNLISFSGPTDKEGLPNLACGMAGVVLAGMFISDRAVSRRAALAWLGGIALLLVSCNLNALNYIWHGFHFTNMLPYRFSFLVSFLFVAAAYRGLRHVERMQWQDFAAAALFSSVVLVAAWNGPQDRWAVYASAGVAAVYLLLLFLLRRGEVTRRAFTLLMGLVMVAELGVNAYIGVHTVRTTDRTGYPNAYADVQALLAQREELPGDFQRTEMTGYFTLNDPALYGYDGVSVFSSTANVSTTYFMEHLGLNGWDAGNRYYYSETSPLANALLGMRYLVSRDGAAADTDVFWHPVAQSGGALLLENTRPLPFGFMADKMLHDYMPDSQNPFLSQNRLFRAATGVEEDLFTVIDMLHVGHKDMDVRRQALGVYSYTAQGEDGGTLKWNYRMPADGMLYAYTKITGAGTVEVLAEGRDTRTIQGKRAYIFPCGSFEQDEQLSLRAQLTEDQKSGSATVFVAYLNREVFDRGWQRLAAAPLHITKWSDTEIRGRVEAPEDGYLYTSLPYERGWTVEVDGKKGVIRPLDGSMATVSLPAGSHEVVFRYRTAGLLPGAAVTLVCCGVFGLLVWAERRRKSLEKTL